MTGLIQENKLKITKEDIEFGFKQQIQAALSRKF